jgi:two-component system sensor histidine kinase RegB
MNFSSFFRLEENLNLDRKTLYILRWIALVGQFIAINLVYFILDLPFPVELSYLIIFVGLITNLFLQFSIKGNQLKDFQALIFLIYDLLQLSLLLYLTGGIFNPFSILMIIPTIVSSTFLSMGTTIILGFITTILIFLISFFYLPLPGEDMRLLHFPYFYKTGIMIAILIGLIFLSYFGIRFSGEKKKSSEAFNKLQEVIYKEYELESLGGQAAAAAHSLGTPLATISVVATELKKEIDENSKYSKDLDLLISQTKRCSEILKKISKKQIIEDKFFSSTNFDILLEEILVSFKESSGKNISLSTKNDKNKINIKRSPEIIYGLRNFIGNAVKFANKDVIVEIASDENNVVIDIKDDGPGFPDDIIDNIGEPYIVSRSQLVKLNAGTGLGTFLGKTLLERKGAQLKFINGNKLKGACVSISWNTSSLI